MVWYLISLGLTPAYDSIKKQNNKYNTYEWVSLTKEINEDEEPCENYGYPNLFIREPKGLCNILKLKQKDPTVFKLWSRTIRAELKNLISRGTFAIESPERKEKIIPTTLVLKVKLTSEGNWDKAKARICICRDVQNLQSQEDTWSPTSSKKTLRMFQASALKCNSKVK